MYQELCGERYEYKVKSINMVEHQKFQGISLLDIRKTSFLLDLITIVTEEILNGNLSFLSSVCCFTVVPVPPLNHFILIFKAYLLLTR